MLARLAAFYLIVAVLDSVIGVRIIVALRNAGVMEMEFSRGLAVIPATLLAAVFNLAVATVVVKTLGKLSGFAAGIINAVAYEAFLFFLVGPLAVAAPVALEMDLVKVLVPWLLSAIPFVRHRILARPPPRGERVEALCAAHATAVEDAAPIASLLAQRHAWARGFQVMFQRRPAAWDPSPNRLEPPSRQVPGSLRLALLVSGRSAGGWVLLSLGLLCGALLARTERVRHIPLDLRGVSAVAELLDCHPTPASERQTLRYGEGRRYTFHYRFSVAGAKYEGVGFDPEPCPALPEIRVRYLSGDPRISVPHHHSNGEPLVWALLLALGALLGAHGGLVRLREAWRAGGLLRRGEVRFGETIRDFPVALGSGSVSLVPVLVPAAGPGRLLVEVIEPRVRGDAGPALLLAPGGPLVPWDQLPYKPAVDGAGRLQGAPGGYLWARVPLMAVALLLGALLVASWRPLFAA